MVYFICFCINLILLLFIIAYGKIVDINIILLIMATTVGNAGYYALASARNLQEAILANNLTYANGLFAPIFYFFIICNICQINIPRWLGSILIGIQMALLLFAVRSIGRNELFYKSVKYAVGGGGAYLIKEYGPVHTVYIITVFAYTLAGIVAAMYSLNKRTIVSRINVDTLLFLDLLNVGVYLVERFLHLEVELESVVITLAVAITFIPVIKISTYSVYSNRNIFNDDIKKNAYISFNKKLKYMGCNEYATVLFPELKNWELEKKIPGSGGRFNTFLRQPLYEYVNQNRQDKTQPKTYEHKDQVYCYEIAPLTLGNRWLRGYLIKISDVTEVLRDKGN